MTDKLNIEAPYSLLDKIVNSLFLKNYMKRFLAKRNLVIKQYAESGQWKKILNGHD